MRIEQGNTHTGWTTFTGIHTENMIRSFAQGIGLRIEKTLRDLHDRACGNFSDAGNASLVWQCVTARRDLDGLMIDLVWSVLRSRWSLQTSAIAADE
ncbi:MAG: hypothetical protein R3E58_00265 [Phycisphaerae bacterium]